MLEDEYPRDINVGFDTIPDHVDAAFALPAPGHNGREKVYFFKGTKGHFYPSEPLGHCYCEQNLKIKASVTL